MDTLDTILAEMRDAEKNGYETWGWADRISALRGEAVAWADLCSNARPGYGGQIYWQTSVSLEKMPLGRYYTAPPAPVVDDAMVDAALNAFFPDALVPFAPIHRERMSGTMRAALEAALKSAGAVSAEVREAVAAIDTDFSTNKQAQYGMFERADWQTIRAFLREQGV